jgi:hypothetical protein
VTKHGADGSEDTELASGSNVDTEDLAVWIPQQKMPFSISASLFDVLAIDGDL